MTQTLLIGKILRWNEFVDGCFVLGVSHYRPGMLPVRRQGVSIQTLRSGSLCDFSRTSKPEGLGMNQPGKASDTGFALST